jgi:hypothetical protein
VGYTDLLPNRFFNVSADNPSMAVLSSTYLNSTIIDPQEASTFAQCGYYARDMPNANLTIVSLNTILWSNSLQPPLPLWVLDPCSQVEFLAASIQGAAARRRVVAILAYVPPGIDVHRFLENMSPIMYWREDFQQAYQRLVQTYSSSIAFQLFGNAQVFSVTSDPTGFGNLPWISVPSISPGYGTNPAYLILDLDSSSWTINDITERQLRVSQWVTGGSLGALLKVASFANAEAVTAALTQVEESSVKLDQLFELYLGGPAGLYFSPSGCNSACQAAALCSMLSATESDFNACYYPIQPSRGAASLAIVITTVVGILLGVADVFYLCARRSELYRKPQVLEENEQRTRLQYVPSEGM